MLCPPDPRRVWTGSVRGGPGSAKHLVRWLEGEIEGNRNSGLWWACVAALEAGDELVISDLVAVATAAGLRAAEIEKTVSSAYKRVGHGR